jgi:hypothetical protein
MIYYVKLKDNHDASGLMEELKDLELSTYEERFHFENLTVEVYKKGTLQECANFIKSIANENVKTQFEIAEYK